jgi:hypothetical protein
MERVKGSPRFIDTPPERLVYDELTRCPYLPGQTARLPMRLPSRRLTPDELSRRLHAGIVAKASCSIGRVVRPVAVRRCASMSSSSRTKHSVACCATATRLCRQSVVRR